MLLQKRCRRENPEWRKELDPMKFETFEAYTEAMLKALDEACKKLGIPIETVH